MVTFGKRYENRYGNMTTPVVRDGMVIGEIIRLLGHDGRVHTYGFEGSFGGASESVRGQTARQALAALKRWCRRHGALCTTPHTLTEATTRKVIKRAPTTRATRVASRAPTTHATRVTEPVREECGGWDDKGHPCARMVRVDRSHWQVHLDISGESIPSDYEGEDSIGVHTMCPRCAKGHAHAYKVAP